MSRIKKEHLTYIKFFAISSLVQNLCQLHHLIVNKYKFTPAAKSLFRNKKGAEKKHWFKALRGEMNPSPQDKTCMHTQGDV
jgi:hypothetical protein